MIFFNALKLEIFMRQSVDFFGYLSDWVAEKMKNH
jgi:hypothetical protein